MALDAIGGPGSQAATTRPVATPLSLGNLAAELAALKQSDPPAAALAQRTAEATMTPVERGQLAAALDVQAGVKPAGWQASFDAAMSAPRAAAAFHAGVAEGVFEGAKSLVVGTATLVGKTVQLSSDVGPAGWLGDKLRGATGGLPGVLDSVVPSGARGAATIDSLKHTATAIGDYAVSRAKEPHKLISDTQGFIERNWDSLKADHAAAAAKGPEAEAKWWGQVAGRAAFEIGITVVPVAGQVGKVTAGARAAETASVAVRVAEGSTTVAAQLPKLAAGDVAANAARHALYVQVLRVTEKANPLVDALRTTGKLPDNFITKAEAELAGWRPGKALHNSVPNAQLGGDVFANSTKILPEANGRVWFEADVGLDSAMSRAKQPGDRLLYSNDGLLYVTADHYKTAHAIGNWK